MARIGPQGGRGEKVSEETSTQDTEKAEDTGRNILTYPVTSKCSTHYDPNHVLIFGCVRFASKTLQEKGIIGKSIEFAPPSFFWHMRGSTPIKFREKKQRNQLDPSYKSHCSDASKPVCTLFPMTPPCPAQK